MSYIGKTPTVGNFIKLDDISTSSTNSYTLQHNSVNFSPESANHMLVSLNGVIQAPNTSYSVSGSTITFLPSSGTLSSSDSIDFIMVYGNVLDVGVATTVSDASITKAKMNLISDSSSAGLTVKGDGSSENGTIQLNCSQNSHGVKISSPAHSSGQSYEMVLPTTNITAGKFLKVDSVSGSGATGVGQLSFADAGGTNTPAFLAYNSSSQNISASTYVKVSIDTEVYDTANAFDNSSNYRFTPQIAGKYFVYGAVYHNWTSNWGDQQRGLIYKNGSLYAGWFNAQNGTSSGQYGTTYIATTVSMNGSSDYLELYGWSNASGGQFNGNSYDTYFGAYKLIE